MDEIGMHQEEMKIAMAGDVWTGKTTLSQMFKLDKKVLDTSATIGFDLLNKTVTVDDVKVKVFLYDMSGSETFVTVTKNYFRIVDGIVIVYDVTKRSTFESVSNWIEWIQNARATKYSLIIIGNKIDCENEREVSSREGEILAENNGALFYETTSKNLKRTNGAFEMLIKQIHCDSMFAEKKRNSNSISISRSTCVKDKPKDGECSC